jgi:hypothetical protein
MEVKRRHKLFCAAVLASCTVIPVASAAIVQFQLATPIVMPDPADNTPPPTSAPPFATMKFTDTAPGVVQLLVSSSLESSTDFVSQIGFNLDPALDPTLVSFTKTGSTGTFTDPVTSSGVNNQALTGNSPGIAGFDFRFDFFNGANIRFDGNDTLTYNLTCPACAGTLDAADFNFVNGGTFSGYFAAAKLGFSGTPVDSNASRVGDNIAADNTISAVDEPATLAVIGAGLLAMGWARQSRRSRLRSAGV